MPDQLTTTSALRTSVSSAAGPLAALVASPPPGATGSGKRRLATVLLVPGYTGSKEDFAPILDPLADAGIRAVAIDLPGQYESPGGDQESDHVPAALGPVITGVVGDLSADGPVALLGHSFGGLVARQAVLQGARIAGLVLLCSGPAAFTSGNRFEALTAGEPVLRAHGQQALFEASRRSAGQDPLDPAPLAQFYRRRLLESSWTGLLGMGGALLTEPDLTAQLASELALTRTPAAVIAGAGDDAWPLADQAAMGTTLGTSLVLVPGGLHSPAVESPDNLLAVLIPLLNSWFQAASVPGDSLTPTTNPTTG